jgi:hypothetical protein
MKNWVRHQFSTERTKEGMQRPSLLCDVPDALCVGKNALVPPLQSHADMSALFGRFKSRLNERNLHASSARPVPPLPAVKRSRVLMKTRVPLV